MAVPNLVARSALYAQTADWVQKAARTDPRAAVSPDMEACIREMIATSPPEAENVVPLRRPATR